MKVRLSDQGLDPGDLLTRFLADRSRTGAVVSFTGLCRADAEEQGLELEAYPGFAEAVIAAELDRASERFGLQDALVVHRTGRVAPGEAIVFVAVAAEHRRAAFQGADYLMDWLKSRAPFWKKAHSPSGSRWVEPRPQDYTDAARWDTHAEALGRADLEHLG